VSAFLSLVKKEENTVKKCLLLGNGINRCCVSNISWEDILKEIAKNYNIDLNNDVSFPLQFEIMANRILSHSKYPSDRLYTELKEQIISKLLTAEFSDFSPHYALTSKVDSILTTNYDFLIEKSLDSAFSIINTPKKVNESSNKYNINNVVKVLDKNVYHIHGNVHQAQSICLGYEHYAGTLQRLRTLITTKKEKNGNIPEIICYLKKPEYELKTWAAKFFTDNIHIVGLGLTQSEIDLWWLITYRAFLYYSNRFDARNLICNTIVYHDISEKFDEDMRYALENCNIIYCHHKITQNDDRCYYEEYQKIADAL